MREEKWNGKGMNLNGKGMKKMYVTLCTFKLYNLLSSVSSLVDSSLEHKCREHADRRERARQRCESERVKFERRMLENKSLRGPLSLLHFDVTDLPFLPLSFSFSFFLRVLNIIHSFANLYVRILRETSEQSLQLPTPALPESHFDV